MDRKRKADGLADIVTTEMDISNNGSSAGTPLLSLGESTFARLSKMVQGAGTSACQNPAVPALLSMAAEDFNVASTLCRVILLRRSMLETKQLPDYPLGLDAVRLKKLCALEIKENEFGGEYVAKFRETEMDYQQKINPLYQRINEIAGGVTEKDKGVPDFWLSALLGNALLDSEITKQDRQPLKHLMKINSYKTNPPKKIMKLEFVFDCYNPFFENTVLTKVVYFKGTRGGGYVVDRTEGTPIAWKEGKCLNARERNGPRAGSYRRSFFNFFRSSDEHCRVDDERHEEIADAIEYDVLPHAYTLYMDTKASGKLCMDPSEDEDAAF